MISIHFFAMKLLALRCNGCENFSIEDAKAKASDGCLGKYLQELIDKYDQKKPTEAWPLHMSEFDDPKCLSELEDTLSKITNSNNEHNIWNEDGLVYLVCGILNDLNNQIEGLQQKK